LLDAVAAWAKTSFRSFEQPREKSIGSRSWLCSFTTAAGGSNEDKSATYTGTQWSAI
jgi:hypothetical protein